MIQCMAWFKTFIYDDEQQSTRSILAESRWGRQHVLCDHFFLSREATPKGGTTNANSTAGCGRTEQDGRVMMNPFKERLTAASQARFAEIQSPTKFVFVAASPNEVSTQCQFDPHHDAHLKRLSTTDDNSRRLGQLPDEFFFDVKWMEKWCPTVAYAIQTTMKLCSATREDPSVLGHDEPGFRSNGKDGE